MLVLQHFLYGLTFLALRLSETKLAKNARTPHFCAIAPQYLCGNGEGFLGLLPVQTDAKDDEAKKRERKRQRDKERSRVRGEDCKFSLSVTPAGRPIYLELKYRRYWLSIFLFYFPREKAAFTL